MRNSFSGKFTKMCLDILHFKLITFTRIINRAPSKIVFRPSFVSKSLKQRTLNPVPETVKASSNIGLLYLARPLYQLFFKSMARSQSVNTITGFSKRHLKHFSIQHTLENIEKITECVPKRCGLRCVPCTSSARVSGVITRPISRANETL